MSRVLISALNYLFGYCHAYSLLQMVRVTYCPTIKRINLNLSRRGNNIVLSTILGRFVSTSKLVVQYAARHEPAKFLYTKVPEIHTTKYLYNITTTTCGLHI